MTTKTKPTGSGEHRWVRTAEYGYATIYECSVCKRKRHYSWTPGWPGGNEYFSAKGDILKGDPGCTALPVGGLFDQEHRRG